jgi:hypothetical protein
MLPPEGGRFGFNLRIRLNSAALIHEAAINDAIPFGKAFFGATRKQDAPAASEWVLILFTLCPPR